MLASIAASMPTALKNNAHRRIAVSLGAFAHPSNLSGSANTSMNTTLYIQTIKCMYQQTFAMSSDKQTGMNMTLFRPPLLRPPLLAATTCCRRHHCMLPPPPLHLLDHKFEVSCCAGPDELQTGPPFQQTGGPNHFPARVKNDTKA